LGFLFSLLTALLWFASLSSTPREPRPVALNLADVIYQTVKQPLPVNLKFASQRKAIKSFSVPDVGKRGFGGGVGG